MSSDIKPTAQPSPSPQQQKLAVFLGRWHTTGHVAAGTSTPAAIVDSIDTYMWYPGEFFLMHDVEAKIGGLHLDSLEILGYDTDSCHYFATYIDSTGGYGTEQVYLDGNTWTWRGSNVMGVKEHRCIAVISNDGNRIHACHEKSADGQHWEPWMDVTLTKQD